MADFMVRNRANLDRLKSIRLSSSLQGRLSMRASMAKKREMSGVNSSVTSLQGASQRGSIINKSHHDKLMQHDDPAKAKMIEEMGDVNISGRSSLLFKGYLSKDV